MSDRRYAAVGSLFTNRLIYPDGRVIGPVMGGAGLYAYSALRLATDNALMICGAGRDFEKYYGQWFDKNHCTREGIIYKTEKNEYSIIKYAADGQYQCSSMYGPEYRAEILRSQKLTVKELCHYFDGLRGIYLGGRLEPEERSGLLRKKALTGTGIMWEMPSDMALGTMEELEACLEVCDIWSLNRPESFSLFKVDSEEAACARIAELGRPCYYRVGKRGAYMIVEGRIEFAPAIHAVHPTEEVDATGCGNASTGAAMWAFFEGRDPLEACVWGNVAAAFTVRQYGPYPILDSSTREEAERLYKDSLDDLTGPAKVFSIVQSQRGRENETRR